MRGTSSREQAIWSGMGHLLSFDGTDTIVAGVQATKWNEGRYVGSSILATEHSVMCSWISYSQEAVALIREIRIAPEGSVIACVADTVSYNSFIENILPLVRDLVLAKNITLVVRPDSGNPVDCVIQGLHGLVKAGWPTQINSKGYIQISNGAVIQGDGIRRPDVSEILYATLKEGFAASNVAFGMGGGLLQDQNRDTMAAATKLSYFELDGISFTAQKKPTGDKGKFSLPGQFNVRIVDGIPVVSSYEKFTSYPNTFTQNILEPIYSNGVYKKFETFDQMRQRLNTSWDTCAPNAFGVSDELMEKVKNFGQQ